MASNLGGGPVGPDQPMMRYVEVGMGDIVRYGQSVGVVIDVTTDNPSPTPGCLVQWLVRQPYNAEQDWVLIDTLEVLREA